MGQLKKVVTETLNEYLRPVRQRRAELETNIAFVRSVLRKGIDGARSVAVKTLEEVREVMNMKI